jgi:hypothetical protein
MACQWPQGVWVNFKEASEAPVSSAILVERDFLGKFAQRTAARIGYTTLARISQMNPPAPLPPHL